MKHDTVSAITDLLDEKFFAGLYQLSHTDLVAMVVEQRQALAVAEERGEFVGAFCRWQGLSRRTDTGFHEMAAELADVVITAYVAAAYLAVDLDATVEAKAAEVIAKLTALDSPEPTSPPSDPPSLWPW